MATKTAAADSRFLPNGTPVRALVDLWPNIASGMAGKVILSNGLSWVRYWVHFENGERVGLIDRKKLATAAEWERRLSGAEERPAEAAAAAAEGGGGDGAAAASTGGVPEYLLERARKARERLAAKKG